jgi:hypothetical protein
MDLAGKYHCAIVGATHLTKPGERGNAKNAIARVMDSIGVIASARGGFLVARGRDAGSRKRVFLPIKANLGTDEGGFSYEI